MANQRLSRGRRLAALLTAVFVAAMIIRPEPAPAADPITTSAQGLRVHLGVLNSGIDAGAPAAPTAWRVGDGAKNDLNSTLSVAHLDLVNQGLLSQLTQAGAINTYAEPATTGTGGRARASIADLKLLGGAPLGVTVGAINTACQMTDKDIQTTVNIADLKVGLNTVNVGVNATVNLGSLLKLGVNQRTATWSNGVLDYTVRALDVSALNGIVSALANASVVVAESKCSGTLQLSPPTTTPVQLAPGQAGTPTVTVTNTGDVAAPNTVITTPLPPTGYTLGTPAVTGGGQCTTGSSAVVCTGVTVPGNSSVKVSLPVTLSSSAGSNAADWEPTPISVVSTPIAEVPATKISVSNSGTLVTARPPTTGVDLDGGVTLNTVTATPGGAQVTPTVRVYNAGDAAAAGTVITIPGPPAGYVPGAVTNNGGGACAPNGGSIQCTGVTVPAGGTVTVSMPVTLPSAATADWTVVTAPGVTATSGSSTGTAIGTLVNATPRYTLDVAVTGPAAGSVEIGETATMDIDVTDKGPSDAKGATFVVVAPRSTTIGTLSGTAAQACTKQSASTALRCTLDLTANGPATRLSVPLVVSLVAAPGSSLTGGCVSLDNDEACSGPPATDPPLPAIVLPGASLADLLKIVGSGGTIVPGGTATASVRITALAPVQGTTVTVPLDALPTGLEATAATGPGGSTCTVDDDEVTCTGVDLTLGVNTVNITVKAGTGVASGQAWKAAGVSVSLGADKVTVTADLLTTAAAPKVVFTVTGPTGTVAPGDTAILTITGTNRGTAGVTGRTVVVVAPTHTTFGDLTGVTAQACKLTSSTVLTCTYDLAAGGKLTWTVPLKVDADAENGDKLTDGCVSADGNKTCGGDLDVAIGDITVGALLAEHGKLTPGSIVIEPGDSGTAIVTISADTGYTGLTLNVPIGALPDGFAVSDAALDGDACSIGEDAVTCTGVELIANTPRVLRMTVAVDDAVAAETAWRATGITLVNGADQNDRLTAAGVLVSASARIYVAVTVGALAPASPKPGETATLPITLTNTGTIAADPYPVSVILPVGTTHGTLPSNCAEDTKATIVTCQVSLGVGATTTVQLPLVVDSTLAPDTTVTGGCVDEALGGGEPAFDRVCGGEADVAIPDFTVGRFAINLAVTYDGVAVPVANGDSPVVKVPYANEGTVMADDVWFTIEPPAGVTIAKAVILLDTESESDTETEVASAAAEAGTVDTTCEVPEDGGENTVACAAPDAAGQTGSELWLTLALGSGVESGQQMMKVTISTASDEGNNDDNTIEVPLMLAAAADDTDDSDDDSNDDSNDDTGGDTGDGDTGALPVTGADAARLALLSAVLVAGGVLVVYGVRERVNPLTALVGAAGARRHSYGPARHARPGPLTTLRRVVGNARPPRLAGRGSDGPARRTPAHAKAVPVRRRRSGGLGDDGR